METLKVITAESAKAITTLAREKAIRKAEDDLLQRVVAIEMGIECAAKDGKGRYTCATSDSDEFITKIRQSFADRGFDVTVGAREPANGYAQVEIIWMK